ncbi:MAG: Fe-S cluster assembly protein SufD [Ketobacter sp.]
MITPNEFKLQAQSQLQQSTLLEWLTLPEKAQATFAELDIPTRKTESWKYTPLTTLFTQDYFNRVASTQIDESKARALFEPIEEVSRLVFVNGGFHHDLSNFSDLENQGIITLFSNANDAQREIINRHLGSTFEPEQHIFATLNYSEINEGVLIHVPKEYKVEQPIHVVYISTEESAPGFGQSRLLLLADSGSSTQLIEQHESMSISNIFHNHMSEMVLAGNAKLVHQRMQMQQEDAAHVNGLHVQLAEGSHYEQHAIALGSKLKRNDVCINFNGSNSYSRLNGVFLSKHQQHIDNHLNLEHGSPHCNSDTVYKGFITDKSRAVFNGRIHIHKDAQKTEAHLNTNNLLLSNQAELNAKPELEIYADDVKCSHGASIGQLDEKSLFYFQSRGIDRTVAEAMLCLGFVNEMVDLFPNEQVRSVITERLAGFFNDVDKLNSLWSME